MGARGNKEDLANLHQCMQRSGAQQSKPNLLLPTAGLALSNPERQGFDKPNPSDTWTQKLDTELCNKLILIYASPIRKHISNPQAHAGSGFGRLTLCCKPYFPFYYPTYPYPPRSLQVKGGMYLQYGRQMRWDDDTGSHFGVLYKAFHKAKELGSHSSICPPPASFASELMVLLAYKIKLENKYQSKKIKELFSWTLPPHIHNALQQWAHATGWHPRGNGLSLGLKHSIPTPMKL
eukprot:1141278-Pelagomonas_calceolata.AAC.5